MAMDAMVMPVAARNTNRAAEKMMLLVSIPV